MYTALSLSSCYTASLTCHETPYKLPHVFISAHRMGKPRHMWKVGWGGWGVGATLGVLCRVYVRELLGGGARSRGRKQYYLCTVVLSRVTARRLKVALHSRPSNPLDF